jgi:hypothetical protein
MSRRAKSRRWDENTHVAIASGAVILVVAGLVVLFGYYVKPKSPPPTPYELATIRSSWGGPR